MPGIVIPSSLDQATSPNDWTQLAQHIHANLPYHRLTFFKRDFAFNIGWHEAPVREVYSTVEKCVWLNAKGN